MAGGRLSGAKKRERGRRGGSGREEGELPEYERQRMLRIGENRARLEALGLPSLASALLGSSCSSATGGQAADESELDNRDPRSRRRGRNNDDVDDDYRPSEEDEGSEGFSFSDGEAGEEDQSPMKKVIVLLTVQISLIEFLLYSALNKKAPPPIDSHSKGKKKTFSNVKDGEESSVRENSDDLDAKDDDDPDFLQAIALSLEEPMQKESSGKDKHLTASFGACSSSCRQEEKKRRKGSMKRPQMTKDELVAYFFSFDETGGGEIRARDLMRVASAHDFSWTEEEMADMICLFDSNGDGKLSLEDFTKIISRCNMLKDH